MCIRDRAVTNLTDENLGEANLAETKWDPDRPPTWPAGFDPVSYTHLRAHETVLDLVCRLLLDKQKHKHMEYCLMNISTSNIKKSHQTMSLRNA